MGIIKGIIRFTTSKINDSITEMELKKNAQRAYYQNGRNMKFAKMQGKRINGSKGYRKQLDILNNRTNTNSKRREQFINDILN